VICHPSVPAVCYALASRPFVCSKSHTPNPGVSIPAVTTKFDSTKHDMRNGMKTGSPVSGCSVESIVFFACHSSGLISLTFPILYAVTSCFAFSRPAADVNNVLAFHRVSDWEFVHLRWHSPHPAHKETLICACAMVSPGI
jgi:hypothetical protein